MALLGVGSGAGLLIIQMFVVRRVCWHCNAVHPPGTARVVASAGAFARDPLPIPAFDR
jgi:hypothetical protein